MGLSVDALLFWGIALDRYESERLVEEKLDGVKRYEMIEAICGLLNDNGINAGEAIGPTVHKVLVGWHGADDMVMFYFAIKGCMYASPLCKALEVNELTDPVGGVEEMQRVCEVIGIQPKKAGWKLTPWLMW